MPVSRSRVLIADDHTLIAELCKQRLEEEFDVVGMVHNGQELIPAAVELKPDVIILDIAMPILNGLDAGPQVKKLLPAVKILYLTVTADTEVAAEALRRGALGYILKTCTTTELVTAVRCVLRGKTYLSPEISKDALNYLRWCNKEYLEEDEKLTERQREVLQLLAEGKVMKEVGDILHISTRTVAFHKYRIMNTLGARTNAELVRFAVRSHIVNA
jgi:DNA-binding NarL/FixJ family response regulator